LTKLASRLQVSLATTKGSNEEDESVRLSLGIRLSVIDKADPRSSEFLDQCYDGERGKQHNGLMEARVGAATLLGQLVEKRSQIDQARREGQHTVEIEKLRTEEEEISANRAAALQKVGAQTQQAEKILEQIWLECNTEFEKQNWNATNFSIGFASIFMSTMGDLEDLESSGVTIYGTLSYGFDQLQALKDTSQLLLHMRYRTEEQIPAPDMSGSFIEQDFFLAGAQLRVAGPTIGNKIGGRDLVFFGEFDYRISDRDGEDNDDSYRYAFGIEYKLADNVTFSLTLGDESGDDKTSSGTFAIGGLKWAL
jgi:hypothetical protein